MMRELRKRTSRVNYAVVLGEDMPEAGPSNLRSASVDNGMDSSSDFVPEKDENHPMVEEYGAMDGLYNADTGGDLSAQILQELTDSDAEPEERDSVSISRPTKPIKSRTGSTVSGDGRVKKMLAPALSRSSVRQMHALPSVHHRHRALAIFDSRGPVERLLRPPKMFEPEATVLTNSWSFSAVVANRVSKSWGYNVGPGPLWELVEDRSWFKEAMAYPADGKERSRRPRVYEAMRVGDNNWDILAYQHALPYLPSDTVAKEGQPAVTCSFGPYGQQTRLQMKMFDTCRISQFFADTKAHVFNAGAPVWGMDWCPVHPDDRPFYAYKQFLAAAPLPSLAYTPRIGARKKRPVRACIQIWTLGPVAESAGKTQDVNDGEMKCEMVLCVDCGPAHELKWCPLPSNDSTLSRTGDSSGPRKLGIVAGTFEDGSLSFFVVPDPTGIRAGLSGSDISQPVFVKMPEPILRIELEDTACWSFDWANSEVVTVGCTNGFVAVYNVANALRSPEPNKKLLPTHYIGVHQSAIRAIAWIRTPIRDVDGEVTADDPTVIVSGGYDGSECVTDIRECVGNVINRTRDVINSVCFSSYCGGPITIDHENIVKAYSLAPGMLGRGHTLLEPDGPVWSVHIPQYHPQLGIGVADGSCLTTNTLRSTRRGGSTPFLVHKIYQLDYSRKIDEFRMLEHFFPKETIERASATRANKDGPLGASAWSPKVSVQRVVWNDGNGLANASLLASATGSGLCRVDWLEGRWMKGTVSYSGIEGIRAEVDVAVDINDSD